MFIRIGDALIDPSDVVIMGTDPNQPDTLKIQFRCGRDALIRGTIEEAEEALRAAGHMQAPEPEPELLTDAELETLRQLYGEGYEYLARDGDLKLYAYRHKPVKTGAYWDYAPGYSDDRPLLVEESFAFIGFDTPESIEYLLV